MYDYSKTKRNARKGAYTVYVELDPDKVPKLERIYGRVKAAFEIEAQRQGIIVYQTWETVSHRWYKVMIHMLTDKPPKKEGLFLNARITPRNKRSCKI